MPLRIQPRKQQLLDLGLIARLDSTLRSKILGKLQEINPPLQKPSELAELLQESIEGFDTSADVFVRQFFSLHGLVRRFGISREELIEGLLPQVRSQLEPLTISEPDWKSIKEFFLQVLSTKIVRLSATANELSYDYANLVRHIRILSDIRPLFDDDANEVEAAVVSHTMRLHYDSADGEHELSLALDEEDIVKLRDYCNRALKKSKVSRKLMIEKACVPTQVSGTQSSGDQ